MKLGAEDGERVNQKSLNTVVVVIKRGKLLTRPQNVGKKLDLWTIIMKCCFHEATSDQMHMEDRPYVRP